MSYPYFFIDYTDRPTGNTIDLEGDDNNHLINVLRAKKGDRVVVSSGDTLYDCRLDSAGKHISTLKVMSRDKIKDRPFSLTLYQSVLKKNPMELVVQKATEIGIDRIVPVISDRVVVDGKKLDKKVPRWQSIAREASKQSKRSYPPKIEAPVKIEEIEPEGYDIFFAPVEDSHKSDTGYSELSSVLSSKKKIAYIIGPEGGFVEKEIYILSSKGMKLVNFGSNILRAETAAIYFLSILDFLLKTS